jgi:hypothetical protein
MTKKIRSRYNINTTIEKMRKTIIEQALKTNPKLFAGDYKDFIATTKRMKPSNANNAWWHGYLDSCMSVCVCPYSIQTEAYWYWDAGWWYHSLSENKET